MKINSVQSLSQGIVPERYRRNAGTVGLKGQLRLLECKAAVVGAGGLGGTVIELLARMGIGYLKIIDGDNFALHNLNRQIIATESNIGCSKADAAAKRVAAVNSDVEVHYENCMLDEKNAAELLSGMDVILDGLDNISSRLILAKAARQLRIPLVHAAIAGWTGQVMTIFPGDKGLEDIYSTTENNTGIETVLGNPAATPALAASLQVHEAVKVLTGKGEPIRNKLLYFDAEHSVFEFIIL